jgi:hypothetical protein
MKLKAGGLLVIVAVLVVNGLLWLIPSDVVELVARDRQTLLGRYSRAHFAWIIVAFIASLVVLFLHFSPNPAVKKRRAFGLLAAALVLGPALLLIDVVLRVKKDWGFELAGLAYHRTPTRVIHGAFEDKPEAHRTYPSAPQGSGRFEWTLTTDHRGFRNTTEMSTCGVIALGDSFTEGSQVSDEQVWTAHFAKAASAPIYNMGVSGYAPQHARASLVQFGLELKPKWVLYAFYEGNDFKQAKPDAKPPAPWGRFLKQSVLLDKVDQFLIARLGPIGAQRSVPELDLLSWLPVRCPPGPEGRPYAFDPSFFVDHFEWGSDFAASKYWTRTAELLERIHQDCTAAGATLVIVYIPTAAHVVLPLVREQLPPEMVRAFTALRAKDELPPAGEFVEKLLAGLDTPEAVTTKWCAERGIPLISLTAPLREATAQGRQMYFTYNAHWTPAGHEVAGRVIAERWLEVVAGDKPAPTPDRDHQPAGE